MLNFILFEKNVSSAGYVLTFLRFFRCFFHLLGGRGLDVCLFLLAIYGVANILCSVHHMYGILWPTRRCVHDGTHQTLRDTTFPRRRAEVMLGLFGDPGTPQSVGEPASRHTENGRVCTVRQIDTSQALCRIKRQINSTLQCTSEPRENENKRYIGSSGKNAFK